MKSEPNILINNSNSNNYYYHHQQQQSQDSSSQSTSYFLSETHNVTLIKSPNYGYGIAISGGLCTSNQDSSIYISDIVPGGPAQNKLMINDKLLSVNGVNVENVEHSFVIRLLKEAKDFIHLVIKRNVNQPAQQQQQQHKTYLEMNELNKRRNQAIAKTAATVIANYTGTNNQSNGNNLDQNMVIKNPLTLMMNKTNFVPSLKPIKVTLNRKDKKDSFGIVLGCQFFIKDIVPNSLASAEANLCKGDILVKLNDLSADELTLIEANKILSKSKDNKLNLIVKRNSSGSNTSSGPSSLSSSDDDLIDENPIPQVDHPSNKQTYSSTYTSSQVSSPIKPVMHTESTDQTDLFKPVNQNQNDLNNSRLPKFFSNKNLVLNYRTVTFAADNGVAIRIAGGNKVGIFICDVQYNTPAERAGLRIGDKIFRVNGVDFVNVTREEAVKYLLSLKSLIEMVVANSPEEYETYAFDPLGGDSFYIRTHFNYCNAEAAAAASSTSANHLSFRINEILHVTDTMYNGVIGQWVATKLGEDNTEQKGLIPNQANAERLVSNAKTIEELSSSSNNNNLISMLTNSSNGMSLGASARMSIRKKLGGKGSLSKRSKSASRSNANSDTESNTASNVKVSKTNTFYGSKYPAYEKVILKETNFVRPVVLFGPLADVARERLKSEMPNKFEIPESYSTSASDDPNSQTSGVIKLASIRSIIDKNRHCLLDITPNAVDHLNYAQYFPICIYLKAQSHSHVKELRQKNAKNMKPKSSKRLYENALRLNTFYSHLFTANVTLDSNQWFKKVKDIIDQQQEQPLWISQDLEHLLNNNSGSAANHSLNTSLKYPNSYDMNLQQQKFIAKQNQIMQQQHNNNNNRYILDDNFEFPIYSTATNGFSGVGATSTYSLYEDNYRSSIAVSESELNTIGLVNATSNSSPMLKNDSQSNMAQPIYSTNFHNRNKSELEQFNQLQQQQQQQQQQQSLLTRVHSDPNLMAALNNQIFDAQQRQYQIPIPNQTDYKQIQAHESKKFHTYSANSLKNLINSANAADLIAEQADLIAAAAQNSNMHKSSTPLSSSSSTFNLKNRVQNNYQELSQQQQQQQQQRRLSSNLDQHMSAPIHIQHAQTSYSNYKLIKNSQSNLNNSNSSNNNNNNKSLLQSINQVEQLKINELNLNSNSDKSKKNESSSSASSLLSQYDSVDNSHHDFKTIKNCMQSKINNSMTNNTNINNHATSVYFNGAATLRKKETPPAKPPPPTLPKPKFILPQTSASSLVLQRNLKAKSELNIADNNNTNNLSNSSSKMQSNNEEIIKKQQVQHQQHQLMNGVKINSSLVSSSQGYHSDTWESHSSRQSFDTDSNPPHPASRYKHFNKMASKLATESKLAKTSILANNNNGSTSDGSVTGSATDDTDSLPNCINMDDQTSQPFHKNIMIEKPTISTTSSTVSTSSNCCASNSSTSSTASSAAAMSNATTLSTNTSNSFSAVVASVIHQKLTNDYENMKKLPSETISTPTKNTNQNISSSLNSKRLIANGAIELPIYYQPSPQSNPIQLLNDSKTDESKSKSVKLINSSFSSSSSPNNQSLNQSLTKTNNRNSYTDMYETPNKNSRLNSYTAHYNDNGFYRKLSLDSNSNCSIIASANGIFDSNGGILESADTGVSINVPEGAIAPGFNYDLYFKVCHCKSNITNSKGELLSNPIVMCGPRGLKFHKPIELQIPHFISIDGQSWSYAFKTADNLSDDNCSWGSRFHKKTLLNSVTVLIDSF